MEHFFQAFFWKSQDTIIVCKYQIFLVPGLLTIHYNRQKNMNDISLLIFICSLWFAAIAYGWNLTVQQTASISNLLTQLGLY